MAKRSGYHHVALRARDLHKTIAFYEALGCTVVRKWGEGDKEVCMMDAGGGNIVEIFAGGGTEMESFPHFEHIALRSDDVDGDYQDALAGGAREKDQPKDVNIGGFYPVRIAFVFGLNDELIEFFHEY
ncbi:MAG: VOC family protein [Firmicutes bacterium]|nr:VOC family protein [Bacillota bacterium]